MPITTVVTVEGRSYKRPIQVGDRVSGTNEISRNREFVVNTISENWDRVGRRGAVWENGENSFGLWKDDIQLIAPVIPFRSPFGPFKVGDKVKCFLLREMEEDILNDFNGAGYGWREGEEFVVRGMNSPSLGRSSVVLWGNNTNAVEAGVWSDWVVLVEAVNPVQPVPSIKLVEKLTIGSDIEVAFVKMKQMVGSDQVLAGGRYNGTREFGTDHGGAVGEFRPNYASHP